MTKLDELTNINMLINDLELELADLYAKRDDISWHVYVENELITNGIVRGESDR